MQTVEEILAAARRLPDAERKRLVAELAEAEETAGLRPERQREDAMKRWLASAGTGHSEHTDVSSSKNRHLADIYATKP